MGATQEQIHQIAHELLDAEANHAPIPPITDAVPGFSVEDAYAVQKIVIDHRLGEGRKIIGKKVGLTSKAMQQALGVSEPDYGMLLDGVLIEDGVSYETSQLLQPRIEGEIAFVLNKDLVGPNVTVEQVLEATEYVSPSLEVIDSRIKDWKIKLPDTIADNASSARVVVGKSQVSVAGLDLANVEMVFKKNGEEIGRAKGDAVLGNPANAVAWLANKLHELGVPVNAGDIIMPGALTAMTPVAPGDTIEAEFSQIGSVSVRFV
jgi:2-keto-4-pentenoate hydratase